MGDPLVDIDSGRQWAVRHRVAAIAIVLAVFVFSSVSAYLLPVSKGPDESDHIDHALYIAENRHLPHPLTEDVGQLQHPPLPYVFMACWIETCFAIDDGLGDEFFDDRDFTRVAGRITTFKPGESYAEHYGIETAQSASLLAALKEKGENSSLTRRLTIGVHRTWIDRACRIPSIILGILTTLCLLALCRRLFPKSPRTALLATACIVLTPLYVMHFSSFNNGAWIAFFSSWLTLLTVRANDEGRLSSHRTLIFLSVLLGFAFLVKLHAAALALFMAWIVWRHDHESSSVSQRLRRVATLAAGPILIAAWWYVRQIALSGDLFPIQNHADFRPGLLRLGGYHPMAILDFVALILRGFFDGFGADLIQAPDIYAIPLAGLAFITFCAAFWKGSRAGDDDESLQSRRTPVVGALIAVAFLLIALNISNIRYFHFHGRYFHSLLAPLTFVFVAGFRTLFGKRMVAVMCGIAMWNIVFTCITVFVILSHRYSIPASKVDRGSVAAYYDCGHTGFDQRGIGGFTMNQVQPELFTPRHTMRYAPQLGPKPEILYRTELPDPSRAYQVRVRYPNSQSSSAAGYTGAAMLADSWIIHGPHSLWNYSELIYALPNPVTKDGVVEIWWQNHLPRQANVACAELWVEEAWISLEGAATLHQTQESTEVLIRIENIDQRASHAAHCMVLQGTDLIGEIRHTMLAPSGAIDLHIPLTSYKQHGPKPRLRIVGDYMGPWASTKLVAWEQKPETRSGRIEVPDIAVLRHTPTNDKPKDLVTVQLRRLLPGRYTVGITHPSDQDPLGSGQIEIISSEGAEIPSVINHRPAYYQPDLLQESFRILQKTRSGEEGSIFITIRATNTTAGDPIDLDRLIVRRITDKNTWGHDYPLSVK